MDFDIGSIQVPQASVEPIKISNYVASLAFNYQYSHVYLMIIMTSMALLT